MGTLLLVGIGIVILLMIVAAVYREPDEQDDCTQDIPCQECGKCYGDHIGASAASGYNRHAYVYPRDLHR